MSTPKFDVTPEKQAGVLRFLYQQITFKPAEVRDVNLQGRTAIVTGSNTGTGFETGRQLLNLGLSKLILAVRNEEKGKTAAAKLLSEGRSLEEGAVEVWKLDLSEYDSILAFVERTKTLERLDYVVLNAGLSPATRVFNEHTGHDETIQVNYLSTCLLALLLLPVVKAKRGAQGHPSRITFVSSEVAAWAKFPERKEASLLSAFDKPGKVDPLDRMFTSKLLGQFFVDELAKHVHPSVVLINAASPATVHDTEFTRDFESKQALFPIVKALQRRVGNKCPVGTRMITDAVVNHGDEVHGQFLSFQKVVPYVLLALHITPPRRQR